jgi:hypothetical protein
MLMLITKVDGEISHVEISPCDGSYCQLKAAEVVEGAMGSRWALTMSIFDIPKVYAGRAKEIALIRFDVWARDGRRKEAGKKMELPLKCSGNLNWSYSFLALHWYK